MQMSADGHLTTLQKVKLAMKCEAGVQQAGFVGENLLATSSADEGYVRVWNLMDDNVYTLSINTGDANVIKGDRLSDFAYNPVKSVLAASTTSGRIVMWRRTGAHVRTTMSDIRGCFIFMKI